MLSSLVVKLLVTTSSLLVKWQTGVHGFLNFEGKLKNIYEEFCINVHYHFLKNKVKNNDLSNREKFYNATVGTGF